MNRIKKYKEFLNEEISQEFSDFMAYAAGLSSILVACKVGYDWIKKLNNHELEQKFTEDLRKDSYLKSIITKLLSNQEFVDLISQYQDDISDFTYDEMQHIRKQFRTKLGSILTEDEYEYVDDTIQEIISSLKTGGKYWIDLINPDKVDLSSPNNPPSSGIRLFPTDTFFGSTPEVEK